MTSGEHVIEVSNAGRVVFPEIGKTKGDVVAYYDRVAPKMLPHLEGRPISIKRYPKGLAGAGFFQKNVPAHYPPSITRFEVPRSAEASKRHGRDARQVTVYAVVHEAEHLPYLANQGAIEIHMPIASADALWTPDRLVIDLDPPPDALALVRRCAHIAREALLELGLTTAPVATGSRGYHLVAALEKIDAMELATAAQKFAVLLASRHPDEMTTVFRVKERGPRVFVDWLRNHPLATVIAPYSLRARPRATVAAPLAWDEVDTIAPDAFSIDDVDRLLDRPDTLPAPIDAAPFIANVEEAFDRTGLSVEPFDRFRS